MRTVCSQGHGSASDDFCDVCGTRICSPPSRPDSMTGRHHAAGRAMAAGDGATCSLCGATVTGQFCDTCGFRVSARRPFAPLGGPAGSSSDTRTGPAEPTAVASSSPPESLFPPLSRPEPAFSAWSRPKPTPAPPGPAMSSTTPAVAAKPETPEDADVVDLLASPAAPVSPPSPVSSPLPVSDEPPTSPSLPAVPPVRPEPSPAPPDRPDSWSSAAQAPAEAPPAPVIRPAPPAPPVRTEPPRAVVPKPDLTAPAFSLLFNPCAQAGKALPVLWGVSA
jgi:hypothetical protein